jgi:hypothetical protein
VTVAVHVVHGARPARPVVGFRTDEFAVGIREVGRTGRASGDRTPATARVLVLRTRACVII